MKTVQDYKRLGLVFIQGDYINTHEGKKQEPLNRYGVGYCNDSRSNDEKFAIEFAWRNNDGVKPDYNGLIHAMLENGAIIQDFSDSLNWGSSFNPVIQWRPVVLKSESPTVSPKEDKPMKPVYTAEMHAKGELPPVGAECILIVNNEPRPAKVTYIGKDIVCCSNVDGDAEYACLLGMVSFELIPKTIKVNGFDVPAPMSENIKVGDKYFFPAPAIERYFQHTYWDGGDFDKLNLARGTIHKTQESAIAHAKAMLGINPNPARGGDGYDRNVLGQNNEGDEL